MTPTMLKEAYAALLALSGPDLLHRSRWRRDNEKLLAQLRDTIAAAGTESSEQTQARGESEANYIRVRYAQ
jgi:hypothetical protein